MIFIWFFCAESGTGDDRGTECSAGTYGAVAVCTAELRTHDRGAGCAKRCNQACHAGDSARLRLRVSVERQFVGTFCGWQFVEEVFQDHRCGRLRQLGQWRPRVHLQSHRGYLLEETGAVFPARRLAGTDHRVTERAAFRGRRAGLDLRRGRDLHRPFLGTRLQRRSRPCRQRRPGLQRQSTPATARSQSSGSRTCFHSQYGGCPPRIRCPTKL